MECLMLMNHPVITDGWRGSLGTFSLQPGSIVLSLIYGVYGILYFLLFCLTLPLPTMRTLCNLGAGAGKLCFKILKEKIFLKKIPKKIFYVILRSCIILINS